MEFFPNFDRSAQQETSGKSPGTSICQNVTLLKGLSVNSLNYYRNRISRHFNRNPIVSVSSIFITKPIVKWIHPKTSEEMEGTLNADNGPSREDLKTTYIFISETQFRNFPTWSFHLLQFHEVLRPYFKKSLIYLTCTLNCKL